MHSEKLLKKSFNDQILRKTEFCNCPLQNHPENSNMCLVCFLFSFSIPLAVKIPIPSQNFEIKKKKKSDIFLLIAHR